MLLVKSLLRSQQTPLPLRIFPSSVSKSWRGQVVSIRCVSDGVPTPTLSWYAPGGPRFNPVTGKENTVDVAMNSDDDFGLYNCTADNGFAPVSRTVRVQQISEYKFCLFSEQAE